MTQGPVFIIGCPRSGTTLLLDLLAGTRAFGYVSTSGTRRDVGESLHGRTRIYDTPLVGELLYTHRSRVLGATARLGPLGRIARQRLPSAIEPWEFWEDLIPTFRPEWGDGRALDPEPSSIDATAIDRTRAVVADLLTRQNRPVLLSKYTDFPRIDLMRAIFPDAKFVHIRRDAHAVANSYAAEIEAGRFGTWDYREWWAAEWPESARTHWKASGETILGFAAHNRNRIIDLIEGATAGDHDVLTVHYRDLINNAVNELRVVLDFAGVSTRTDLGRLVESRRLDSTNDRWRENRSADESALLDEILLPANSEER